MRCRSYFSIIVNYIYSIVVEVVILWRRIVVFIFEFSVSEIVVKFIFLRVKIIVEFIFLRVEFVFLSWVKFILSCFMSGKWVEEGIIILVIEVVLMVEFILMINFILMILVMEVIVSIEIVID